MVSLDMFFKPASVAIIGASGTAGKIGYHILENVKSSFSGPIYPINPNRTDILGLNAYPSVLNIKEPIDLAIIAVKKEILKNVIEECIKKKIKGVVVVTAGFSEIGEKEAELELKNQTKRKIRVLGPNCIGVYTSIFNMIFHPKEKIKYPSHGPIGILSQSGAVGSVLLDIAADEGVGIGKFVSFGNQIDVNDLEILEEFGKDPEIRCIAFYTEHLGNGRDFIKIAQKISKRTPIVVLKAGKSEKGEQAIISHTGRMASPANLYSAAFKQSGVMEVSSIEELFDASKILATQPLLKGKKLAIVTDGGGFGVLATDEAQRLGFDLPELSKDTVKTLKLALPEYAVPKNPVDLTGDSDSERYRKALDAVLKDKEVSCVICITLLQIPALGEEITEVLRDAKMHGKPLVVVSSGSEYTRKINRRLESMGIPVFPSPQRAARALNFLWEYGKIAGSK